MHFKELLGESRDPGQKAAGTFQFSVSCLSPLCAHLAPSVWVGEGMERRVPFGPENQVSKLRQERRSGGAWRGENA